MRNREMLTFVSGCLAVVMLCLCATFAGLVAAPDARTTLTSFFDRAEANPTGQLPTPTAEGDISSQPQPAQAEEQPAPPVALPSDALAVVRAEEAVLGAVYEGVAPSVVNISVSGVENSVLGDLGQGSGFVWDQQGHIVTNNHVVEEAETILVTFSEGSQFEAEIVGMDPDSDLAVIQVDAPESLLQPVTMGESSLLRIGQLVIAIGNPFGFDRTLTMGVVSGVGRAVPGQAIEGGSFSLPNLVQTDAAINPGNSGGPLLDVEGRVIGVNTLIFSQNMGTSSGVGFAVPGDKVKAVVPDLIANGEYQTPYLGLNSLNYSSSLTPELAEALGLEGVTYGVMVDVRPGGPSDQAGVRGLQSEVQVPNFPQPVGTGGDVVIAVDGTPVRSFTDIVNYLDTKRVGDTLTLTVIREGEQLDIPVTLGARPETP